MIFTPAVSPLYWRTSQVTLRLFFTYFIIQVTIIVNIIIYYIFLFFIFILFFMEVTVTHFTLIIYDK